VFDNALVWLNGPCKASQHDLTIFRSANRLKDMIPKCRRVIADNGYDSDQERLLSTSNSNDPREVPKFKAKRELGTNRFNEKIKNFRSLAEQFQHGVPNHKIVFEAVCVICRYQLENGSPLFDAAL
jgi:hypothetical protein